MEVTFLHLTGSDKMLIAENYDKPRMYAVIPRTTTTKTIQREKLKNTRSVKMESLKCLNNLQAVKKMITGMRSRGNKQKTV